MKKESFQKYMQKQMKEIEVYKYLESEKAGRDLGQEAVYAWIKKYSKKFRKDFIKQELLEESLKELCKISKPITEEELKKITDNIKEKIVDAVNMLEENGNGNGNGHTEEKK